ncbi:MAG TPA: hypothetical protein VKM56_11505 [Verrucomicrobiae bacterium]|nr:hypothetical protein [Verrucomicrobiae bacterium]
MIPEENEDVRLALQYQMALFGLVYRYLACLFSVGLLTIILLIAVLLHAAVSITATMLSN